MASRDLGSAPDDLGVADDLGTDTTGGALSLNLVAGEIGGPGTADDIGGLARLNDPFGLALDGAGNMYVTESTSGTIRKIVLATGQVTKIFGVVSDRKAVVDGYAKNAQFAFPQGLALDGAGNLYVSDISAIRKIDLATGVVGTLPSYTPLGQLAGMVLDGAGNLYVVDVDYNNLHKLVLATGEASTIASGFTHPYGLTVDSTSNLYVADTWNSSLSKVVPAAGIVSPIALTGGGSLNHPFGLAADGAGNLYIAGGYTSLIQKVVLATGAISTVAGSAAGAGKSGDGIGTAAQFFMPSAVVLDGMGSLYISDMGNNNIRKMELATGLVSTVIGAAAMSGSVDDIGAAARFNAPQGVAADRAGNVYVADTGNFTIRRVVLATGAVSLIAGAARTSGWSDGIGTAARFYRPSAVAADDAGNVYVADTKSYTIRKIVLATGLVSTIAGVAGMRDESSSALFYSPQGMAADGAGNLYITDLNGTLRKLVLATGELTTVAGHLSVGGLGFVDGIGTNALFSSPQGVSADGLGNLYIADTGNNAIRKFVIATGAVSTIANPGGLRGSADGDRSTAQFNAPRGVSVDTKGNLYVADTGNSTIRKIALATGRVTTVVGVAGQGGVKLGPAPARLNQPTAVAVASTGELIVVDGNENVVLSIR